MSLTMNRPGSNNYQKMPNRNIMRKPPMKAKAPTNKALNKKIKNIQNNLIELRKQDFQSLATATSAAGVLINQINFTSLIRSGLEINATSLTMKLFLTSASAQTGSSRVRCIVFWDRQPNGANAVLAGDNGLLDNLICTDLCVAPRNYTTIDRYKIIDDFNVTLNPQAVSAFTVASGVTTNYAPVDVSINKYYKLSRVIRYDGVAGTIVDSVTNTINIAFFTDAVSNFPTFTGGYRLYFKD